MQYKKIGVAIEQVKSFCKDMTGAKAGKTALMISAIAAVTGTASANSLRVDDDTLYVLGHAVTGFNRVQSQPIWNFGEVFGLAGMNTSFAHNPAPGATSSIDLTPTSSPNTMLASGFDPNMAAFFPPPAPEDQNVKLRDIETVVNPVGFRAQVPNVEDALPWQVSKSYPNDDITLGDWLTAAGEMKIVCHDDSLAIISIKARNLVTYGLYTLWGMFEQDLDGNGSIDAIAPAPLGGIPNALVPDETGRAEIRRRLGFCPMKENTLKVVTLAYHADGIAFGGQSDQGGLGLPAGTSSFDHLSFPVNYVDTVSVESLSVKEEQEVE